VSFVQRSNILFSLALTSALVMAIFTAGCRKNPPQSTESVVMAIAAPPTTLDPRRATDAYSSRLTGLMFSSLVRLGPGLQLIGDAAESWSLKPVGKGWQYEFKLRSGLRYPDGSDLSADDIRSSFSEYLSPDHPSHRQYSSIQDVEVIEKTSSRFVRLRLKNFDATLLANLQSLRFFKNHNSSLIGTGPFALESQNNNEVVLRANRFHPYAKPKVERVVFKVIRDDNIRFLHTYKGEIDIVQSDLPASKIRFLRQKGHVHVYEYPGLSMSYILLNLTDPVLKNLEVRRALAHAIDRPAIIRYKLEDFAKLATSVLSPGNPFHNLRLQPIPHSAEKARTLLKPHLPLREPLILKTSNSESAVENGRILVRQLQQVGLDVRLQSFEWGTFYGDLQRGRFQMATLRWVGSFDPDIYRLAFHSQETPENSGRNRGFYRNPDVDQMLDSGRREVSSDKRKEIYNRVQETVFADLPIIPLWYDTEVAVVHRRVHGYVPPDNGDFWPLVAVSK